MSEVQTIAKLVANLGFTVDDKQLTSFITKVNSAITALKDLRTEAKNKLSLSIALDKKELIGVKKAVAGLGNSKVRLKDVEVSHAALSRVAGQLINKVGTTTVKLKDVKLSETAVREINKSIKQITATSPIKVPILPDTRQLGKDLREWIKSRGKNFKIFLKTEVNKHDLYVKLNEAIKEATAKVGSIKLKDPKIMMGIDKQHLRTEIRDAIAQIRREVKIKIDLNGHASGSPNASGRAPRGGFGARHGAMAGGVAGAAAGWGRGFIPGLGGAFAVSQLNKQVQEFESQQQAAAAVSGSQEKGTATLDRLRTMGNEVGFNYRSQAMPFLRMISSGTNAGMGQGEVETIFGNMAKYGRVMGLDDESMKGSMRAVEQMLNKQQVYSEELKTQLAERMPGVISAMAEAVTGDPKDTAKLFKMMEDGEVKSTEVMLKFSQILEKRAQAGGALAKAMQSTAAEQARFNNSWNDFVKKFGESGFSKTMADFFRGAAKMLEAMAEHADSAARAFRILLTPILALMQIIEKINFGKLADDLGMTTGELQTMAMVVGGLLFPWTRMLTIIGLVITAVDDLMTWSRGGESLFGGWFEGLDVDTQVALLDFFAKFKTFGESIKSIGETIWIGWKGIFELMDGEDNALLRTLTTILDLFNRIAQAIEMLRNGVDLKTVLETVVPETDPAAATTLSNVMDANQRGPRTRRVLPEVAPDFGTLSPNEKLAYGLGYMKQSGVGHNGQKAFTEVAGTSVRIDLNLTADEVIKRVADGSLPAHLEALVERGTKEWIAKELGGAGARLADYGE